MWALRDLDDDGDCNPSIYLKSDNVFKLALIHIEHALEASKMRAKQKSCTFNNSVFESKI